VGGKNMKKILLLVMKVSAVTSTIDDVFVTFYFNNTQKFTSEDKIPEY
jgi:hypothetical protein